MKTERLLSLDVLRGLTVALMILVNNPGSWGHIYAPLRHAAWHGWTPTDLVFPFFLFAVGVSVSLAFARRLAAGADRPALVRKVLSRTALIFACGLLLNGFPYDNLGQLRLWGVLQRIAACYLVTGLTVILVRRTSRRLLVLAGLLVAYEALMRLPLVPGWGHGSFALADNFARWIDLRWPGPAHLYQGNGLPFDPEGLLSTLPAAAGTLAGFLTGDFIRRTDSARRRLSGLAAAGALLSLGGLALGQLEPINKQLWTVSYTLLTTGLAQLTLAACIWSLDGPSGHRRWAAPALAFGSNALLAFLGSGLLARSLSLIHTGGPEVARVSLKALIYNQFCVPLAGPTGGSLVYAALNVGLWWAVLAVLYRRRIFVRI